LRCDYLAVSDAANRASLSAADTSIIVRDIAGRMTDRLQTILTSARRQSCIIGTHYTDDSMQRSIQRAL